jgi:hypothetical protein
MKAKAQNQSTAIMKTIISTGNTRFFPTIPLTEILRIPIPAFDFNSANVSLKTLHRRSGFCNFIILNQTIMERDKQNNLRNRDDSERWPDSDAAENHATSKQNDSHYTGINKDVSGNDMTEENRDEVRHHQAFGNKHYESFKNHSSADDQPMTDTGA